jgi:hypothetical protein
MAYWLDGARYQSVPADYFDPVPYVDLRGRI